MVQPIHCQCDHSVVSILCVEFLLCCQNQRGCADKILTSLVGLSFASAWKGVAVNPSKGPRKCGHAERNCQTPLAKYCHPLTTVLKLVTSVPVARFPILFTTPIPLHTRPKMACLPSSQGVTVSVMKNCAHRQICQRISNQAAAHRLMCRSSCKCRMDGVKPTWLPFVFGPAFAMLSMPAPVAQRHAGSAFTPERRPDTVQVCPYMLLDQARVAFKLHKSSPV